MPLDKQIVDLKIGAGMDEQADPYLSTRPVAMQNLRYTRTGALSKRRGSTTIGLTNGNQLVRSNSTTAARGAPEALYSYRGSLTILRGRALDLVQPVGASSNLYQVDYVPRQIGNPTIVTKRIINVGNTIEGATTLKVVVGGITYYGLAYIVTGEPITGFSSLVFTLYSEGLGNLFTGVVEAAESPNVPANVRLAWNGAAGIHVIWGRGAVESVYRTFNVQTLTFGVADDIPTITAKFGTDSYDVQYDDAVNMIRLFYHNKATNHVVLDTVDPITLARNNSINIETVTATNLIRVAMQIQQYIGLAWSNSDPAVGEAYGAARKRQVTPGIQMVPKTWWSSPGDVFSTIGVHQNPDDISNETHIFCGVVTKPSSSGQLLHAWRAYTGDGIVQYAAQTRGTRGWISQPGPNSVALLPEMDATPAVYFQGLGGFPTTDPYYKIDGVVGLNIIHSSAQGGSDKPSQAVEGVFAFRGFDEDIGIVRPRLSLPPTFDVHTGLMSGGMVSVFDGANVVESAPFGAPLYSKFSATQSTSPGGPLTPLMTYGYAFIFAYVDALGRKYRSAITYSPPLVLTGTNNNFSLTVPAAYMGNALDPLVSIEIYRTVGNGATFYFLAQRKVTTAGTISFSEFDITDTILRTREILYNTDGSDQAVTGPACDTLAYSNGRVWCVGTGDDRVYFTSDVSDGDEPRFTSTFSFPVLSPTPIIAVAQLDTSTILWSTNEIFRISGDGPALAPSGGGIFSPPQPIASEDGCFSPRSVITLDEGVAYQNKAGIKLLSRGGQVVDYGADIGPALGVDGVTYLIGKALWPIVVPELEEVRWLAQQNSAITHVVTDRYLSRTTQAPVWYTYLFSQPTGASEVVAQCMHNNLPTWVTANGYVYRDDPTSCLDNADSLPSLWVTADVLLEQWRPQSVNGFMRIWKVALLAERKSPHDLTFRQFYNFSTVAGSTLTWTSSEIAALDRESLQVRCRYQRLNGIQVRITDATPSTGGTIGTGEGLSIKGVSLELGIDRGVVRRPAASQK